MGSTPRVAQDPSVISGVECEVVLKASSIGLPTFVPKGRAFTVKAQVGTLMVSAFGLVFWDHAAVSFLEASTQTTTRVDQFAVATLMAKSLALETSDGFLLQLFGAWYDQFLMLAPEPMFVRKFWLMSLSQSHLAEVSESNSNRRPQLHKRVEFNSI